MKISKKILGILLTFSIIFTQNDLTNSNNTASAKSYDSISNSRVCFGLGLRTDHERPGCSKPANTMLTDYHAYYCNMKAAKKKKKVIYLTFDCGYEGGYTRKILKTLKKNNIKAIFFVTKDYIEQAPNIVKRMKKDGHLVGNHTCSHPDLTNCSVSRIKKEIKGCARTMKKLTGYEMDKYVRPPMGIYSKRVLAVLNDMGYSTVFWSLAYYDYEPNDQPAISTVVDKFKTHYFPGMMPLIHVISKSNMQALPKIIKFFNKKKYRFATVDKFMKSPRKCKKESKS